MSDWRRLFSKDLGRKILALLLACTVWWWVNQRITVSSETSFVVKEVRNAGQPELGTLGIRPPQGWQLARPIPGTEVRFWFEGARERLQQFLEGEPAALYDADSGFVDPGPNVHSTTLEVEPEKLRWRRPDDALALLDPVGANQHTLVLHLERRRSMELAMNPQIVRVMGTVSAGYRALSEHMSLSETAITLSGPFSRVEELARKISLWEAGNGPAPLLLEPLQIDGTRADIERTLHLHASLTAEGLSLTPESVKVLLPIVLDGRQPISFIPEALMALGSAEEGLWDSHFNPGSWTAELINHPDLRQIEFSQAWVNRHLRLFLALNELPTGATEYDLSVHWTLVDLEPASLRETIQRNLIVSPNDDADSTVRMTRRTENP